MKRTLSNPSNADRTNPRAPTHDIAVRARNHYNTSVRSSDPREVNVNGRVTEKSRETADNDLRGAVISRTAPTNNRNPTTNARSSTTDNKDLRMNGKARSSTNNNDLRGATYEKSNDLRSVPKSNPECVYDKPSGSRYRTTNTEERGHYGGKMGDISDRRPETHGRKDIGSRGGPSDIRTNDKGRMPSNTSPINHREKAYDGKNRNHDYDGHFKEDLRNNYRNDQPRWEGKRELETNRNRDYRSDYQTANVKTRSEDKQVRKENGNDGNNKQNVVELVRKEIERQLEERRKGKAGNKQERKEDGNETTQESIETVVKREMKKYFEQQKEENEPSKQEIEYMGKVVRSLFKEIKKAELEDSPNECAENNHNTNRIIVNMPIKNKNNCPNCMCGRMEIGFGPSVMVHRNECDVYQRYITWKYCVCGKTLKDFQEERKQKKPDAPFKTDPEIIKQHKNKCPRHRELILQVSRTMGKMTFDYGEIFKEYKQILKDEDKDLCDILDFESVKSCVFCCQTPQNGYDHFHDCTIGVARCFMMALVNSKLRAKFPVPGPFSTEFFIKAIREVEIGKKTRLPTQNIKIENEEESEELDNI